MKNWTARKKKPRILVVTPEITYLPHGMGNMANYLTAKGGGLADVSASLVGMLFDQGVDIHVALPHYRKMFNVNVGRFISEELLIYKGKLPHEHIHLAEDRAFYYRSQVYESYEDSNMWIALVFQREVINNIIPRVRPNIIHCNDWMTGLIPAMARRINIPCLFTLHNIHSVTLSLAKIESSGIDVEEFWLDLYYGHMPTSYEQSRHTNPVDLLASGIFSSHFINTVSPTFLKEIVDGKHEFITDAIRSQIANKVDANCAVGVLNSPDPTYNPETDNDLIANYGASNFRDGKNANKRELQKLLGLAQDVTAPMFFWPSRLDPVQKGCQLLTDILYQIISGYWKQKLQVVVVASGPYQCHFHDIVRFHELHNRAAIVGYDERLSRLAYAASDFMLMPSLFEPCGLPQMICQKYGSLPVARDTGGIHDTVSSLDANPRRGNGFLFKDFDSNGLRWAIDQAMSFYFRPVSEKKRIIARVMRESSNRFNQEVTSKRYLDIYNRMRERPMVSSRTGAGEE